MAIYMDSKNTKPHPAMAGLIAEISEFLDKSKMGKTYFGRVAVGNSELVARLKTGCEIRRSTEDRVREYLRVERIKRAEFPDKESLEVEAAE